jgi:hypothetical protein
MIRTIPIASFTQNRKLDPQHLTPVYAPSRVPITVLALKFGISEGITQ